MLSYRERAVKMISHAHRTLQHLKSARAFEYDGAVADLIPATFCLLGCIGEALTNAMQFLNPDLDESLNFTLPWDFVLAFYPLSSPNYVPVADRHDPRHSLDEEEWCPSTVRYLIKRSNVSALRHALRRGPRNRGESHDKCTEYTCLLQSVDVDNYVPKHADGILCKPDEACACPYIKPPRAAVTAALAAGAIPVIRLPRAAEATTTTTAGDEKLAVALTSDGPYVAISHVWTDGMGSNTETGLPACQLWKLAALAQALLPSSEGRFWLDALCVPKQPAARQQALKLMGQAYRDAEYVVVRDASIEACSQDASSEEVLLRVLSAPWMRRLWTLQEALLARRLLFVMRDGVVPLGDVLPREEQLLADPVLAGLAGEVHRLTKMRRYGNNSLTFADVARALRWRATSRASDEIPAIVSLLLDAEGARRVLDAPVEGRMERLLLEVGKVPKSVVFLSGPKLGTQGFGWAPKTFMTVATGQERGGRDMNTSASAVVTPEGLVDYFCVYRLEGGAGVDEDGAREFTGAEGEHWVMRCGDESFAVSRTHMETGKYRCNFVLCTGPNLPGDEQQLCLGVCGNIHQTAGEEDTLSCVYGTRLVIRKSPRSGANNDDEEEVHSELLAEMHKVCIS
ncbi:Het domain-containing protein [Lasiodiplodia theobromae]|uniref:Het domain-containing protein n=1 Tax=Lasiodiplodia theobromae TaxID=45133 RepID=UPI0015C3532E|nr:Het domain-containing protein [Lasiodiplodia theobromae]KAF4545916.1 Het domain-containing protein [Lasiodiplodia theobromae]